MGEVGSCSPGHMAKNGSHDHIWKRPSKIISRTTGQIAMKLGVGNWAHHSLFK